MVKNKFFKKAISAITALSLLLPNFANLAVSAEEPEKFQYTMFARNGITMSASSNLCMNGNLHTNKDAAITAINKNINGKVTTSADIEKRVKHVYADQKIHNTYFATNCEVHEEEYTYSDMNIHINNPLYCYSNITLDGNVSLNSSLGTLMNINVTGEVKNANNSVVYSKYGNITIENDSTANVNGLIYAPLGTVTINSPNVTINGIIIADQVVINGSSININCNDNIARFIGTTSEVNDFSDISYLPMEWLGDSDNDGLIDIYEIYIDTNKFDPDTDQDSVPDGYEVFVLGIDPADSDSDSDGLSDGAEDFDNDELCNSSEYMNGTDPFLYDTDKDTLSDGLEVNTYFTNPLLIDTDDDGLSDSSEGVYGSIYAKYGILFEPLLYDTDEDGISDGDESFVQVLNENVTTHDEAITNVSVELEISGLIDDKVNVINKMGTDVMTSNVTGLVGDPFEIKTSSYFKRATIGFSIDKSKLGDTDFNDLIVLWYDETNQRFVECNSSTGFGFVIDSESSIISITTSHFSQYMVVDSKEWYQVWEDSYNRIVKGYVGNTSFTKEYDFNTILTIDTSGSMTDKEGEWEGYDPIIRKLRDDAPPRPPITSDAMEQYWLEHYGYNTCRRITACENFIDAMYPNDKAAIVTFSWIATAQTSLISNKTILKDALQNFKDENSTNYSDAILTSIDLFGPAELNSTSAINRILFLSDGEPELDTPAEIENAVNTAIANGIRIDTFGLGTESGDEVLKNIANQTGGKFYKVINANDLTRVVENATYPNPDLKYLPDEDGDGIPDVVEQYGIRPNGELIGTDPNNPDTDEDGVPDGEEILFSQSEFEAKQNNYYFSQGTLLITDPLCYDSDGDGLDDGTEYAIGSDPLDGDSDDDLVDDDEEYILGYDPNSPDTDKDTLSDGEEMALGYDPSESNADGDDYDDAEELRTGKDPYVYEYEKTAYDHLGAVAYGVIMGDFAEEELIDTEVLIAQIGGSFVPVIADARDALANAIQGNWAMAGLSIVGLAPVVGDAIKAVGNLGQAVVKIGDDIPTITKVIIGVAEKNPDLIKYFSKSDEVVDAIKSSVKSDSITKESLEKMLKYADEAGVAISKSSDLFKNGDNVIDGVKGVWKQGPCKRGADIDEFLNSHLTGDGLGTNFPVFDRIDDATGTIISTKSLDLGAKSYKDPKKLRNRLQKYIDQMSDFEKKYPKVNDSDGMKWGDTILSSTQYTSKKLELVIPDMPMSTEQAQVIQDFINKYGISIVIMKG